VVEHLKNKDPLPAYRGFRDKGRMSPEGLLYVSGWVDDKHEIYQLMETADPKLTLSCSMPGSQTGTTSSISSYIP
jgi:hypothetical protein